MRYDIGVIGGGPGGYVAAIKGAQAGAKVVIFEEDNFGGTCLNRGCIPTKALLKSGQLLKEMQNAKSYGIQVGETAIDFDGIMARKNAIVNQLTLGVEGLLKKNKVTIVKAKATLGNRNTIYAGGERYEVSHVILACGSIPAKPPIKGIELAVDSDYVLDMKKLPKSMIIVGGGVIGVEFAVALSMFGVSVTIVEMLPSVLNMADTMVIKHAEQILKEQGVQVICNVAVQEILEGGLLYKSGNEVQKAEAELVLVATGRKPNVCKEQMDSLGICYSQKGIETDVHMQTNVPGIFAIGDVNGKSMLAHTAMMEGAIAVKHIMGETATMHYDRIPSCVYTTPEIAWIGMTESEAKKLHISIKVGTFAMMANAKSMIEGEASGEIKLIMDERTGEIIGGHLVCCHATDMIMEVGMLMGMEGVGDDILNAVHPHPTVSEAIFEAAEALQGKAVHI